MAQFVHTIVHLLSVLLLVIHVSHESPVNSTNSGGDHNIEVTNRDGSVVVTDVDYHLALKKILTSTTNCFPAIGFNKPQQPPSSLDGWWCDWNTEYAFVGFSYEVEECQSLDRLTKEFTDIRQRFRGRYVRIYGACDRNGFYDDVIRAAWQAGIGVHTLIWFGFNGGNMWMTRRDNLITTLHSNPLAKFVVRAVQFGSEPLFDGVLSPGKLAQEVQKAKTQLSDVHIPVTVSDLIYSYQTINGADSVLSAIDIIDVHVLPFFDQGASTAKNSWPIIQRDLSWLVSHAQGKKIYLSQTGWPSVTSSGVQPNNDKAIANVQNERDYYKLLDAQCSYFKALGGRGVGWFAHIYSDEQEPGYGIYDARGNLKFPFNPQIAC